VLGLFVVFGSTNPFEQSAIFSAARNYNLATVEDTEPKSQGHCWKWHHEAESLM